MKGSRCIEKNRRNNFIGPCYAFSNENEVMAKNAIKIPGVELLEQMANLDDKETDVSLYYTVDCNVKAATTSIQVVAVVGLIGMRMNPMNL